MLYITQNIGEFNLEEALAAMPPSRRAMVMEHKNESARRAGTAAYMLLRQALSLEYGIGEAVELGIAAGGKPFIIGHEDIFFNLSHCRTAVACAVSTERVGVDVEAIRTFNESLARRVFSGEELDVVMASARPDIAFTRFWTMKESYLKMTGEGIRCDLKAVDLGRSCFETTINADAGYVCTVCKDR